MTTRKRGRGSGRPGGRSGGGRGPQRSRRASPPRSPGGPRVEGGSKSRPQPPAAERVEGRHAVRELLLAGTRPVREVVVAAGLESADVVADIVQLATEARVPVRELSRTAFDDMAITDSAQGVLAEAAPLPILDLDDLLDGTELPFLVMLDGVTDPHNLGAVFRSADAAGATGLVLPRHRAVGLTATVAKTSAGAIEHVPVASVAGVPAAISRLQDRNVWVVGLDQTGARSVFDLHLADEPLCLVLGAEGAGLSRLARERCDELVSIPMRGAISSLNVSAAGAVAMFEVARRRG